MLLSSAASMRLYETLGFAFFRLRSSLRSELNVRRAVSLGAMEYTAISPGTERAQLNNLPNSGVISLYTRLFGCCYQMRVGHGVKIKRKQRVRGALPHAGLAVVKEEDISVTRRCRYGSVFFIAGLIALRSLERCEITSSTQVVVLAKV